MIKKIITLLMHTIIHKNVCISKEIKRHFAELITERNL